MERYSGAIRFPVTRPADTEGSVAALLVLEPRLGNQAGFFYLLGASAPIEC